MKTEEVRQRADDFVSKLEKWQREENRGVMARLRRGLSEATRHEAWLVLGPHFGPLAIGHIVYETVGGCFALHPSVGTGGIGNFGETLRRSMPPDKMRDEKEPHTRFRRLLACASRHEICQHVRRTVRLAKSQEQPVNYRKLFEDLWWWNDRTKVEWAKAYWDVPADVAAFSLAGVGSPVEGEPVTTEE